MAYLTCLFFLNTPSSILRALSKNLHGSWEGRRNSAKNYISYITWQSLKFYQKGNLLNFPLKYNYSNYFPRKISIRRLPFFNIKENLQFHIEDMYYSCVFTLPLLLSLTLSFVNEVWPETETNPQNKCFIPCLTLTFQFPFGSDSSNDSYQDHRSNIFFLWEKQNKT